MLYRLHKGGVHSYRGTQQDLFYLCSTEAIRRDHDVDLVATDRNAAIAYARFSDRRAEWDDLVDWELMKQVMWNNTAEYPDRVERRMAECLAHGSVPWSAIMAVRAANASAARAAESALRQAGADTEVLVRPEWYF